MADADRDGRTDWQPYPVDPYSATCDDRAGRKALNNLNPRLKSYYGNNSGVCIELHVFITINTIELCRMMASENKPVERTNQQVPSAS